MDYRHKPPRRGVNFGRRSGVNIQRRLTRQAAQARDDFAQVMDEPGFVKELIAGIPTGRDQAFVLLRTMLGSAVLGAALVILWLEAFWRHCL
jgi:hypothetical protein